MAVSGTVSTTKFNVRKVIDHAFRRCRLSAQQITAELQDIARANLYLMMSEMANKGYQLWTLDYITDTFVLGQGDYTMPLGTVDVLQINYQYPDGREVPLTRVSQDDYNNLPNKGYQGRPVQYWLDRQRDAPVVRVWPVPNPGSSGHKMVIARQRHLMDVGELTNDLDIPQRWLSAIIADLAWRIALEAPEVDPSLVGDLKSAANEAVLIAQNSERDQSPMRIVPRIGVYTR